MTTTRQLCRVLATALHVPGVERHAARLVRDGLLPRSGEEIDEHDAAVLLLTVLGTTDPNQASQTAERLAGLSRVRVSESIGFWTMSGWIPATDADQARFALTLVDLIRDILKCLVEGLPGVYAGRITVARDDADVTVLVRSGAEFYRVTYGAPSVAVAGLRVSASISGDRVKALADSLKPDSPDRLFHTAERAMPSLAIN